MQKSQKQAKNRIAIDFTRAPKTGQKHHSGKYQQ
jgi:hypothetical protein